MDGDSDPHFIPIKSPFGEFRAIRAAATGVVLDRREGVGAGDIVANAGWNREDRIAQGGAGVNVRVNKVELTGENDPACQI